MLKPWLEEKQSITLLGRKMEIQMPLTKKGKRCRIIRTKRGD